MMDEVPKDGKVRQPVVLCRYCQLSMTDLEGHVKTFHRREWDIYTTFVADEECGSQF